MYRVLAALVTLVLLQGNRALAGRYQRNVKCHDRFQTRAGTFAFTSRMGSAQEHGLGAANVNKAHLICVFAQLCSAHARQHNPESEIRPSSF